MTAHFTEKSKRLYLLIGFVYVAKFRRFEYSGIFVDVAITNFSAELLVTIKHTKKNEVASYQFSDLLISQSLPQNWREKLLKIRLLLFHNSKLILRLDRTSSVVSSIF